MKKRPVTYIMADAESGVVKVGRAVNVEKRAREHNFSARQHSRAAIERIIGRRILLTIIATFDQSAVPEKVLIAHFKRKYRKISSQHYEWFHFVGAAEINSDIAELSLGGCHA